jgi:5-methylcytosine-specific restriction enzyme A
MKAITTADVKNAIRRYDKGERPYRFIQPRSWYLVIGQERLYPLKYIYALATNQTPSSFNTSDPIRVLQQLDFDLKRVPKDFDLEFLRRVEKSLKNPQARSARLALAPQMPAVFIREVATYLRNPDVVAEVLSNAKGICQTCNKPAPFFKKSNGEPFLEVHHVVRLADGGVDTVANAVAVCPNCHRCAHYG